jgi:2-polyprenyl-3-methyl-5-hydroxy-6-metoxy-1,4-benzoquinol methylase
MDTNTRLDRHYTNPQLTALYDISCGWSEDRSFYLSLAQDPLLAQSAFQAQDILDLGCGTGLLCRAYAEKGHRVVGVDPAAEMLNVARSKSEGSTLTWIQSTAQDVNIKDTFDLIIMTGHAFQVLLTEQDVLSTFQRVQQLLKPNGQFVFESRNPNFDWPQHWDYKGTIETERETVESSRRFVSLSEEIMTFELSYRFQTKTLVSMSQLRFWGYQDIEKLLAECGLKITACSGDWQGQPLDLQRSEEMVFHVTLKP